MNLRTRLTLLAEKVGWTFLQQFALVLLAADAGSLYHGQQWLIAADSAGFAALICILTSVITTLTPLVNDLTGWADVAARTVLTFVQSFFGSLTASAVAPSVLHAPWQGALAVAVPVTFMALLKAVLALRSPATIGASTVSNSVPAPAEPVKAA